MFYLNDEETEKLSDIYNAVAEAIKEKSIPLKKYRYIRALANHVFSCIWNEEINKVYIHDGKFEQFDINQRRCIFNLKFPTLTNFNLFKEKINAFPSDHPVLPKILEILADIQEIVSMIEEMDKLPRTK